MKRAILIILTIILIVLLCVTSYFTFIKETPFIQTQPSGDVVTTPPMNSELYEVRTSSTKTDTQRRIVNVEMPAFSGLTDYAFQENINKKIAESINPYINEIAIVADESVPATAIYRYTVTYERYNNDDYISLVVLQNYSTVGLRSNVWKDTYTIDVVKNKEVKLADICDSSDYKSKIVAEVNRQAKARNIELVAGNGLASIPDTQRFYIKDKKLYIYFEPASIAPYLDGEMHFEMPYEFVDGKFIVN